MAMLTFGVFRLTELENSHFMPRKEFHIRRTNFFGFQRPIPAYQKKASRSIRLSLQSNRDTVKTERRFYISLPELAKHCDVHPVSQEDSSSDDFTGPRSPYIAVIGNAYKPTLVYIITEGTITCMAKSFMEGIYLALCTFNAFNIEYPSKGKNSWSFIQYVLAEEDTGGRPPKKLLSLRGKL